MKLLLKRFPTPAGIFGTFGELYVDGELFCYTVEREWKNNEGYVSCVPVGIYDFLPHESPRYGDCYALEQEKLGVTRYGPSQRTHVLMHVANKASQLAGCIAPGDGLGSVSGEWAVTNSENTFNKLMDLLNGQSTTLEIVNA
ncbi:hypothetical protein PNIG_a1528 [Pseudoalteromonas nigrifaciens]|uniref:DUF5675 domain-containing protein n=1 Tax=Pseudoalteromonas nigrifaciens TaxID=28109 RepID=A0AAC9UJ00_9GAMM|nr:DUF5675 family protein [Pseudoalteromonas nigrifaciens]ASM53677.1 hypothetical protein PNIG_a1528 [Pseudoalteromonas nigrifaciens]GEN40671.1 hypothetical protein PNI02_01370 [Pseudoalteromonas nigrifaciens]SUC52478.1 Uncharacterised protein [Pseudoalteromonas nigrifaciens]